MRFSGCESFERGRGRYVRPLSCNGKAEGRYEVGEDRSWGGGKVNELNKKGKW